MFAAVEGGQSVAGEECRSEQCSRLGPHQTGRLPVEGRLTEKDESQVQSSLHLWAGLWPVTEQLSIRDQY